MYVSVCIYTHAYNLFLLEVAQHVAENLKRGKKKPLTDFIIVNKIESYCKNLNFYPSSISRLKRIPNLCL